MAQSQIICDASEMGKTRVIRTKSWERSHDFAPVGGVLRTPAACRTCFMHRHTGRGPNKKLYDCSQDFSHNLRWPTINRRRPPNNLRQVTRLCVGLQIEVEIQCLRVVSGDLRLNRRRPSTLAHFLWSFPTNLMVES